MLGFSMCNLVVLATRLLGTLSCFNLCFTDEEIEAPDMRCHSPKATQWEGRVGFKPRLVWSLSWSLFCCMSSAPEAWFPGWSRSWSPGSLVLWGDLWGDPGITALCPAVCWRADVCLRPHCPNPQATCRADSREPSGLSTIGSFFFFLIFFSNFFTY